MTRRLAKEEGLFVGGSAGSAVAAAIRYAQDLPADKTVVVILPDVGSRYLSKFYNDDWMRQNRFLASEWVEGTVDDGLRSKSMQDVITVSPREKMADVVRIMKEHDVSQLPVIGEGKLLGLITEVGLLEYMVREAPPRRHETIGNLVETEDMEVVDHTTPLEALAEVFSRGNVAVVLKGEDVRGIVNKIDLIDFLASRVK